eukprot:TRINITY_DN659_c0_g1_i1.p1 TRINITY_DN659_c0_g1~~TRINITY_DN659_c0_g1_i1.p1  ORF type:complete len:162 (+),score=26.64 TRINITY_DN659_c0_g1_i1:72-557(+)
MGNCLKFAAAEKDLAPRERRDNNTSDRHSSSRPIVIDGSQHFSDLVSKLGTTPSDAFESEQQQLRHIISRAAKDFIDISSAIHSPPYEKYNNKIHVNSKGNLPIECLAIFALPAGSTVHSTSLPKISASDVALMSSCAEHLSVAVGQMKVSDCGEIIATFD